MPEGGTIFPCNKLVRFNTLRFLFHRLRPLALKRITKTARITQLSCLDVMSKE